MSTVGYGDRYPVTAEGRLVAGVADGRRHRVARCHHRHDRELAAWRSCAVSRKPSSRPRRSSGTYAPRSPNSVRSSARAAAADVHSRASPAPRSERPPRWTGGRRRRSRPPDRRSASRRVLPDRRVGLRAAEVAGEDQVPEVLGPRLLLGQPCERRRRVRQQRERHAESRPDPQSAQRSPATGSSSQPALSRAVSDAHESASNGQPEPRADPLPVLGVRPAAVVARHGPSTRSRSSAIDTPSLDAIAGRAGFRLADHLAEVEHDPAHLRRPLEAGEAPRRCRTSPRRRASRTEPCLTSDWRKPRPPAATAASCPGRAPRPARCSSPARATSQPSDRSPAASASAFA